MAVEAFYQAYKDNPNVAVFLIYVKEHTPGSESREFTEHKTLAMRAAAAAACAAKMNLHIPVLLDTMDGAARNAYDANSAATAIIDLGGNLVFHAAGQTGVRPDGAAQAIESLLRKASK